MNNAIVCGSCGQSLADIYDICAFCTPGYSRVIFYSPHRIMSSDGTAVQDVPVTLPTNHTIGSS